MKKKTSLTVKILSAALAFLIIMQASPLTFEGLGAAIADAIGSIGGKKQSNVLPDVENDQWMIPEATVNPNEVDMTIRNGIVYNDHVYTKLMDWGFLTGYHHDVDPRFKGWRDYTASVGPMVGLSNYRWVNDANGNWIDNSYVTTIVKRSKTEYGIYKNIVVPTLRLGGYLNIEQGRIKEDDVKRMINASKANLQQSYLRVAAIGGSSAKIEYYDGDYGYPRYSFTPKNSIVTADLGMKDYFDNWRDYPAIRLSVNGSKDSMIGIHVVMIDNTSPSVQNVTVSQENDMLVVRVTTNENVRWAADAVSEDLDDIWIEVDLQVIGTEHKQTVRAHVSGIDYKKNMTNFANTIVFKGELGPFADLDYKVLDISNVNVPREDYPITAGTMLMVANQTGDFDIRNHTLSKWDAKNNVTVYETYDTTAICDLAGNPLNLEAIVNWELNRTEIKNDSTFVRKIEFINDKTLLGSDIKNADGFMDDITRADYFFGPRDVITPRLSLNKILTDEEVSSFRVKTNVKDEEGEYIWLSSASTGRYMIGTEEFMYIDFEPISLSAKMSADAQDGNHAYFEITEISCTLTVSPPMTSNMPAPEKTLYIDLIAPEVSVESNSEKEPGAKNGYFKLDIEVNVKDADVDGMLYSGMLEQGAYFYLSGCVNEATPIKFVVNTSATAPATVAGYTGSATLVENGKVKLNESAIGMTSNAENKAYIHLLIPEKENLLINDFAVYVDVTDAVGNGTDVDHGHKIEFRIDRQRPEIKFIGASTVFTSDSAITTVKVEASDYNNVEAVQYQWVEAGDAYDDSKWEPLIIDASRRVLGSIVKQFEGTGSVTYDAVLYVKCRDDRGNESVVIQRNEKINIEKPTTSYEAKSDLSIPSTHPEIIISGPLASVDGRDGYTRVTVSPQNPAGAWKYVTVVKSGEQIDLFAFDDSLVWYKVATSGSLYTRVELVDGETVTLDELKKYYGNVKISFENAFSDLTPVLGFVDEGITDGSYIADQNYITARFASLDDELTMVNTTNFGYVTDKNGNLLASDGDRGAESLLLGTSLKGVNGMNGVTFYFNVRNVRMGDWGLLDVDFDNSTVELLRSDNETTDELVYFWQGLAHSDEQYFSIPAFTMNDEWFKTGVYRLRVTVKSRSGSVDAAESLNIVYDAGTPENYGLVSYSHDLRYENGAYRTAYSGDPIDSFGIAVQPGREVSRNNVFAVYEGGVTGFSFTIGADDTSATYDGHTVGKVEGFRYWNSLSAPTAEELDGYEFSRYDGQGAPCLIVTSGVESIYTESTIPKGAHGFGDIYLVEGINTICYQVKMKNGYVTPVKQFTVIVTQYTPEFNVIVEDYTPSYYAAQQDGQVNAHDITMKIEEAFSLNGSGNVRVELWSNYPMTINGQWQEQTYENSLTQDLTCLSGELKAGDTAVLTRDSYTSCFPPYSGQGNQCSAVFAAIDEYGGMVVFAPQIGALSRLNEPSDPYDDLISIDYYGSYQDDPFTIGRDMSFIEIYNDAVYFGAELVGFQTLRSTNGGDYVVVERSIPELQYNLFAISSNSVEFMNAETSWTGDRTVTNASWDVTAGKIKNYELIDWDNTKISFYDAQGNLIAENVNVQDPTPNAAGFVGGVYGESYYPTTGETVNSFKLMFANPSASSEHPVYDWSKNSWDDVNANSTLTVGYKMTGINVLGDAFEMDGEIDLRYIDYSTPHQTMTSSGIVIELPFESSSHGELIHTGVFNGAGKRYSVEVIDAYGNSHVIEGDYLSEDFDTGTSITYSTLDRTSKAVVINLSREDGTRLYVDVTDAEIITVEGNGTDNVVITVSESIDFTYKYIDGNGNEVSRKLSVENIVKPKPYISVDVDTDFVLVDENGTRYRYGTVKIKLVDDNFTLTDVYTGTAPSFTFTPGGDTTYVFSKNEILASFGDEEPIEIPSSLEYSIDFELREVIDPLEEVTVTDAPSLKISAFKEDRGYFVDARLALILEPTGIENTIAEDEDGITLKYAGKRVSAATMLSKLGWGSAFRFLVEINYGGAYKTFIKEGAYTEAPDYENGTSDIIDGVTLNGRLISVEKNTEFTFFVVAKNGNYTSVVFDVSEIGNAPKPTIVKLPINDKAVKVYVVEPDGAIDFKVTPADIGLEVKADAEGDYAGVPYVEYDKNDDYLLNYSFTFNGEKVNGVLDASVHEIRIREMKQNGVVSWSANNKLESTDKDVSATLSFSEVITAVEVIDGEVDSSKVKISHSGRQIAIRFLDNHNGFTLKVSSDYGDVVVTIGGVDNIDREAPVVKELHRELSRDGKTVTLIIATYERTVFREGGYIGEQKKDEDGLDVYVYTRRINANGLYTYHFTDMSGIESSITVEITEIADKDTNVYFSFDKSMDTAVTDPSKMTLKAGDKVYVLVTEDAKVSFNGDAEVDVKSGEWHEIVLNDGVGGAAPYVTVTDGYGRIIIRQFSQIVPRDSEPPIVTVQKNVITVTAGSDRAEVERLLLANVIASDRDEKLSYSVEFAEDISVSGTTAVTYTVTDSNGNTASAECKLRVVSEGEPRVMINGTQVDRDGSYYTEKNKALTLSIDVGGQPYAVYFEKGIKTVAQMKIGSTNVTDGYVKDASVELGELEGGYYTVIVQTQSRDYFRIIIYVY